MTDRAILFSAPMVRALLDSRKTQTRRVVKWRNVSPGLNLNFSGLSASNTPAGWVLESASRTSSEWRCDPTPCPYGQPGDRLWVRETWARDSEDGQYCYRADIGTDSDADDWERNRIDGAPGYRWRPSIHMPRAASRITLEVVRVRVERLQGEDPRKWYADLWEQINGTGSWEANPWVWVVEFNQMAGASA